MANVASNCTLKMLCTPANKRHSNLSVIRTSRSNRGVIRVNGIHLGIVKASPELVRLFIRDVKGQWICSSFPFDRRRQVAPTAPLLLVFRRREDGRALLRREEAPYRGC